MTVHDGAEALAEAARTLAASGLTPALSGNLSVRSHHPTGFLITPTGIRFDKLQTNDLVALNMDGGVRAGSRRPSSEYPLHAAIYRARPEAGAIVHTHSRAATALACTGRGIPAFHYMIAAAGGNDIRCASYATFGTGDLAAHTVKALIGRKACLMANHGVIALGTDIEAALRLAQEVESLAEQYILALQLGDVRLLSPAEMEEVHERFQTYGQPSERRWEE